MKLQTLKQDDEKKTAFFLKALRSYFSQMLFKDIDIYKSAYNHLLPFAAIFIITMRILAAKYRWELPKITLQEQEEPLNAEKLPLKEEKEKISLQELQEESPVIMG